MAESVARRIAALRQKGGITPQELIAVAEAAGFVQARTRGSHRSFKKAGFPPLVTVPLHGKDLKRSLALAQLRIIERSLEESERDG